MKSTPTKAVASTPDVRMVHIRLEPEMHKALTEIAESDDRTLAATIRVALAEWSSNRKVAVSCGNGSGVGKTRA